MPHITLTHSLSLSLCLMCSEKLFPKVDSPITFSPYILVSPFIALVTVFNNTYFSVCIFNTPLDNKLYETGDCACLYLFVTAERSVITVYST